MDVEKYAKFYRRKQDPQNPQVKWYACNIAILNIVGSSPSMYEAQISLPPLGL